MKPIRSLFTGTLCAAVLVPLAIAEEPPAPRPPGPPPESRTPADMIRRADQDGDGKMSREEFVKSRTAELEEAFKRMDANEDGFVDAEEVAKMGERMRGAGGPPPGRPESGPGEGRAPFLEQAFQRMDQDANGQLSKEEFLQGMGRMRELMQGAGGPGPRGDGPPRRPAAPGSGQPPVPPRPEIEGKEPAPAVPPAKPEA